MPRLLHDPAVRDSVRARVQKLRPDTPRRWGKMTVDQMLRHCNLGLKHSLGHQVAKPVRVPLPRPLMKFLVLNLPWPKGAPTAPDWVAGDRYSFEQEQAECLRLIDEFTSRGIDEPNWTPSPAFGKMNGAESSRLQAKHLDHHLRQFGV